DTAIDRPVEARSDVNDKVVLEYDTAIRQELVSAAVVADYPSTLDQGSHDRDSPVKETFVARAASCMLGKASRRVNVARGVDRGWGAAPQAPPPLIEGPRPNDPT